MRLAKSFILVFLISGCADTYEMQRTTTGTVKLDKTKSAYVVLPSDGRFEQTVYYGSGATTAQEIASAFSKYLENVTVGLKIERFETALVSSKDGGYSYLIYPEILHWEERATEWSGRPDRIKVKITLVDTATGNVLDSGIISGTSKWATLGGDHPEDLLPEPTNNYVKTLFE